MTALAPPSATTNRPFNSTLLTMFAAGGLVSLSLGVYANVHTPTGQGIVAFGFPAVLPMKAWFTTGAAFLALTQAISAAWMWGKLGSRLGAAPGWVAQGHRWSGVVAFLLTLPVAYHCLWALGWQGATSRVLIHSLLGCAFYGALTVKLLVLRTHAGPSWMLPVLGGTLVTILVGVWFTSSLWFFTNFGFPGI